MYKGHFKNSKPCKFILYEVIKGLKLLLIVSVEIKIGYGNKVLEHTALYFSHFSHSKVPNSGCPMQYAQSHYRLNTVC